MPSLHVLLGFGGVPSLLPSDAEVKTQNGISVMNRPAQAPIGLTQQLRLQQQQMQQQLQQQGVCVISGFVCILSWYQETLVA